MLTGPGHDLFQLYFLYNKKNLLNLDVDLPEGFTRSHFEVLFILDDLGQLPMSSVAIALSYSKAYITAIADALYEKGLLRRVPSKSDRRVILLSLTECGQGFLTEHRLTIEADIEKRISVLEPDVLELLGTLTSETVRILSTLPESNEALYDRPPVERRIYMSQPTSKYFPVFIENIDAVPEMFFKSAYHRFEDRPFPYTIHIPGFTSADEVYNPWLLVLDEQELSVFCEKNGEISEQRLCTDEIFYLERGCILLYSWLDIRAFGIDGPIHVRVEFNTVREDLMQPIIDRIRAIYSPLQPNAEHPETAFQFLKDANLKFYNFAHESMTAGHPIDSIIYQPEINKPVMHIFRKCLQDAHLTMLNENELVDIEETGSNESASIRNLGAVWHYFPRRAINHSSIITDDTTETIELVLDLKSGQKETLIFSPDRREALEAFVH